jgi:hypothetical protein
MCEMTQAYLGDRPGLRCPYAGSLRALSELP